MARPEQIHPPDSIADPRLAVVVVNYNSWPDVARLVDSLAASPEVADGRCEVVVVDNASDGPVPERLLRPRRGVWLVARDDNGGFAAGVNAGWRATRAAWLLLLNPDVVAGPDLPGRVLARLDGHTREPGERPAIIGFGLRNPDGTAQPSVGAEPGLGRALWEAFLPRSRRKYKAGWRTRSGPAAWVTGACALVESRLLADLGGMDEDFFLYYEEVALCRAARDRGRAVVFDPSVEVVHLRPLQNRPVSPRLRVITRHSKLLYFRKHLPAGQFAALWRLIVVEAAIRRLWARLAGRHDEARAWAAVGGVARAMGRGASIRGREVLRIAEAAVGPSAPAFESTRRGRVFARRDR